MLKVHFYVIIAAAIMLFFVVVYGFVYDHKEHITMSTHPNSAEWLESFRKIGVHALVAEDISHDDDMWYFKGASLCVGYGDWTDRCKRHEAYCGGDSGKFVGTMDQQTRAIAEALKNGGVHPKCPLLYPGAN